MIVFQSEFQSDGCPNIVLVFGTGLIGSAICKSIEKTAEFSSYYFPWNWDILAQNKQESEQLLGYLDNILPPPVHSTSFPAISIVWSAGKAGFSASKRDVDNEKKSYKVVLGFVNQLAERFPSSRCFFHLLSSAGGLFEGQGLVNSQTVPDPRRYYGQLKYEQEKMLLRLDCEVIKHIYRPTSVYGFTGNDTGHRLGLISTLLLNGVRNRVSTIFGNLHTLRDYVFNGDVGDYIARHLFSQSGVDGAVHYLGSGKPSSIYEIKHFVEQALGRQIYLQFLPGPETENMLDIVLKPDLLPENWAPADVKTGIRKVRECIISESVSKFSAAQKPTGVNNLKPNDRKNG